MKKIEFAPVIILTNPQMGENIGAAARAMLNFGLKSMRIVSPRDGWPNQRAIDMASGAFDVIDPPQIFTSLKDAAADLQILYATTARPRDMVKPVYTPRAAALEIRAHEQGGIKTGLVFGGERAGLSNEDITLCQNIITAPLNPDFSSLNLGQAVLLLSYEYFTAADDTPASVLQRGKSPAATHKDLEGFLERLENILDEQGFFRTAELRSSVARNIRAIFMRSDLSAQEISTLHGIITALIRK